MKKHRTKKNRKKAKSVASAQGDRHEKLTSNTSSGDLPPNEQIQKDPDETYGDTEILDRK